MSNVVTLTRKQVEDRIEKLSLESLGVSKEDAYKLLEQGKLDGLLIKNLLESYLWLLSS